MAAPDRDTTDDEVRRRPRRPFGRPGAGAGHRAAVGDREPLVCAVTVCEAEARAR